MLLFRVAHLDCTNGTWTNFKPPEPLEIVVALELIVTEQQTEHRKRVESVKNGLHELAKKMRMPG